MLLLYKARPKLALSKPKDTPPAFMRAVMPVPAASRPLTDDAKPTVPDTLTRSARLSAPVPETAARSVVVALSKV